MQKMLHAVKENFQREFVTVRELSKITGLDQNNIYRAIRSGNLQHIKINYHYLIPKSILSPLSTTYPTDIPKSLSEEPANEKATK